MLHFYLALYLPSAINIPAFGAKLPAGNIAVANTMLLFLINAILFSSKRNH